MELNECRVGQKVYVVDGTDWFVSRGPKEELEAARTTHILAVNGNQAVVFKPQKLGGYDVLGFGPDVCKEGWMVDVFRLQPINEPPKVKPYPHQCKVCKAPARNVGKLTLCSQDRCKSRAAVKRIYKSVVAPVRKVIGVDAEGYPLCPECGARADHVPKRNQTGSSATGCIKGHLWEHEWRDGQKLDRGIGYHIYQSGVFNYVAAKGK